MLTKEKIIAAIEAMPETEFEDVDILLERIVDLASKEQDKSELNEPAVAYQTSVEHSFEENEPQVFSPKDDAEMMAHIDKKLSEATDPETIYLIKKIKRGIENIKAGNFYTVEQAEAKINSWFKK